jgi:hypothetical protein
MSHCGPLVHRVIKCQALWTISAQNAPATINMELTSNPKPTATSTAISLHLTHIAAISCNLVNLRLGFLPLDPWSLPVQKCSKNPLHMRAKS